MQRKKRKEVRDVLCTGYNTGLIGPSAAQAGKPKKEKKEVTKGSSRSNDDKMKARAFKVFCATVGRTQTEH